jgi:hypothetical protein
MTSSHTWTRYVRRSSCCRQGVEHGTRVANVPFGIVVHELARAGIGSPKATPCSVQIAKIVKVAFEAD